MMRLMGAATAVVEDLDEASPDSQRLKVEASAIRTRLGRKANRISFQKITFVQRSIIAGTDLVRLKDDEFLGYVVIGTVNANGATRSYVFESIIREFGTEDSNLDATNQQAGWLAFLHVKKEFKAFATSKRQYQITGTFFCQQNAITNVCAHACASMMLNNCRAFEHLVTAEDINKILGIDHKNRMQDVSAGLGSNSKATHEGLYPKEISRVFREYGFRPYPLDLRGAKSRYYREFLYGFIESGFPAMLTFNSLTEAGDPAAHVVAAVGHSLNRHSWFPTAYASYVRPLRPDKQFISSLNWVDDFIVHDDNFGMQLCLPAHSFRPEDYPNPGAAFTPDSALGIFPESWDIKLTHNVAESYAWDALISLFQGEHWEQSGICDNYYVNRLRPQITGEGTALRNTVLRTMVVTREEYLKNLQEEDNFGKRYTPAALALIEKCLKNQPHFWLAEVTESNLYVGNQTKVLDVLIDPRFDSAKNGSLPVMMIRLPDCIVEVCCEEDNYKFAVQKLQTEVQGHLPLARRRN